MMKGKFITFEGGEGAGKSTQIKMLYDYLKQKCLDVITSKEPGGTDVGMEIRKILVCGDKDKIDATAETLLYFADRHIHMSQKVWPAMKNGTIVLGDRFADSTVAYQYYGYDKKVKKDVLEKLYEIAVGDFKPDLTIILDIDPKVGLMRSFDKAKGMDVKELRFETMDMSFHENLRKGFLEIAKSEPERCVVLNADKTPEDLHADIVELIEKRMGL